MRVGVFMMVLGLVACTKPNPNRCCTDQADCDAHDIPMGTGCGSGLVCRGNQCIAEVCSSVSDCDLSSPFCVDSSCTSMCTADDQCPGNGGDPAKVHCEGGACVSCRMGGDDCPMTAPVCDAGACRACAAASECGSGVCDFNTGTCLDELTIVYASPTGDSGGTCMMADPCTVDRAFAVLDASRNTVKLLPGTHMGGTLHVTGATNVAIYGPATLNVGDLAVLDGGTLHLVDLDMANSVNAQTSTNTEPFPTLDVDRVSFALDTGVYCATCVLNMTHSTLHGTDSNGGAELTGALVYASTDSGGNAQRAPRVTIDASSFDGCDPTILAATASYTITNSVITNSGTRYGAITSVQDAGLVSSVQFSTFYNSTWGCSGTVIASNNIFVNDRSGAPANTVTGGCTHSYSLIKPQATAPTGSNLLVNIAPGFVNPSTGDLHLLSTSPAIDAADPAATISADYDGTPRPQGSRRDIGAFEHKP